MYYSMMMQPNSSQTFIKSSNGFEHPDNTGTDDG